MRILFLSTFFTLDFFEISVYSYPEIYNSLYLPVKFQLDNIITEYEHLEAELTDPSIYNDLKRLKSTNQKRK